MVTELNILEEKTIAEIVSENFKTAEVFKRNGIDFCCGGKKPVKQVCEEKGLDENKLIEELQSTIASNNVKPEEDFAHWNLDTLIDHIVNTHHKYVLDNLELIKEFADKVARVHGEHSPETIKIAELWRTLSDELFFHLRKEEQILFPYVHQMLEVEEENKHLGVPGFQTVQNPIRAMEFEHDNAGDIIKEIQHLSNNFTPPEWACNTYKVLYFKLQEFQNDLFKHIHLENNILFPKAIALEKKLSAF
jgi:regulator of cell morphogenesis and NO signaling